MRKQIFYVDDSEPTRFLLKRFFEADYPAYEVTTHATAEEAVKDLQARPGPAQFPQAVITDLNLSFGREDGLRLVAQLRARFPELHIILVSGSLRPSDVERGRAAGAGSFVEKDLNMKTFASQLVGLIERAPAKAA